MSGKESKSRVPRSDVTKALNHILSDLQLHPNRTIEEHAEALHMTVGTIDKHYDRLVKDGLASRTDIVLTRAVPQKYQRFWIFVATTYESKSAELLGPPVNYQQTLSIAVATVLKDHWKDRLIFRGIDVILGSDYDILIEVAAKDHDAVHDFVTQVLRTRPYVLRTSTGWARSVTPEPHGESETHRTHTTEKPGDGKSE